VNPRQVEQRVTDALTQLKLCHRERGVVRGQVSFTDIWHCEDVHGRGPVVGLVVDVANLPLGVDAGTLTSIKTLHHLETVLECTIKCQNTKGITYAVFLDEPPDSNIPDAVPFTMEDRPEGDYMIPLGVGPTGPVWKSLTELDSILVAGTRRMGKSTWVNSVLAALLKHHTPEQLKLAIIDPKRVDFGAWAAAPHLLWEIAREAHEAALLLEQMFKEMNMRSAAIIAAKCANIDDYNKIAEQPMPRILIVCDEAAYLQEVGEDAIQMLSQILSLGGAFGIHVIVSTQRPDAQSISSLLKANLPVRISFWFQAPINYRIALEPPQGARVPRIPYHKGRFVLSIDHAYQVLQGYRLDNEALWALAEEVQAGRSLPIPMRHLEMMRWARDENEGYLSIAAVDNFLGERREGEPSRKKLCKDYERAGWLEKDPQKNNARRLTIRAVGILERFEDLWQQ